MINDVFSFKPVDTLFFRGAEPMVMGESHSSNFNFPPPSQTIEGAIRTLLYFKDKNGHRDLIRVGKRKGGFNIFGPVFLAGDEIYVPAPYSWYRESSKKCGQGDKKADIHEQAERYFSFVKKAVNIPKIKIIKSNILDNTGFIKIKSDKLYWAKPENDELESIGENWINIKDLLESSGEIRIFSKAHFFAQEQHVGIALEKNRTVRKSHIYSFNHARLMEDVEILFLTDEALPVNNEEVLTLGAEQRFGLLKRLKNFESLKKTFETYNEPNDSNGYMCLSIIKGDAELNRQVIATGKIQYLGGWDLCKSFHKDMIGYFPAGTVFKDKVCDGLVPIK